MKILKLGLITIFLLVGIQQLNAQWTQINTNINFDILDVDFISLSEGYLAAEKGLYYTQDSGATWSYVNSHQSATDSLAYIQSKFTSVFLYSNYQRLYIGGRDTVNNKAVVFSCSIYDNKLKLDYSNTNSSGVNGIDDRIIVGDDGLIATISYNSIATNGYTTYGRDIHSTDGSNSPSVGLVCGDHFAFRFTIGYSSTTLLDDRHNYTSIMYVGGLAAYAAIVDSQFLYRREYNSIFLPHNHFDASNSPTLNRLFMMYRNSSAPDSYLIGSSDGIYVCTNYGKSWDYCPSSASKDILCFDSHFNYGLYNTIIAGGRNGVLLKTSNAGGLLKPFCDFDLSAGNCINSPTQFSNQGNNSYSYKWYVDGVYKSSAFDYTQTFTSVGNYQVKLVAENGTEKDSISHTIQVTPLPSNNLNFEVVNPILCHQGNTDILIHTAENNIRYKLYNMNTSSFVDSKVTSSDTVTLNTGVISDSTEYMIYAENIASNCGRYISSTINVFVEQTQTEFHINRINAKIGEGIQLYDLSDQSDLWQWKFNDSCEVISNQGDTLMQIRFPFTGLKEIKLISQSAGGCTDSIQHNVYVYSSDSTYRHTWAFLQKPNQNSSATAFINSDDENNLYHTYSNIGSIVESTTGKTLNEQYSQGFLINKYSPEGILKWSVKGESSASVNISDMVYHSGYFYISTQWSAQEIILTSNKGEKIYSGGEGGLLIKMDTAGNIIWFNRSSAGYADIDIDSLDNIFFISQKNHASASFYSANGILTSFSSNTYNYYHGKCNTNGNYSWINPIYGNTSYYFNLSRVACDKQGNSYISGASGTSINLTSSDNTTMQVSLGGNQTDMPLIKCDSSGIYQWGIVHTGVTSSYSFDDCTELRCDANNNILMYGDVDGDKLAISNTDNSKDTVDIRGMMLSSFSPSGIHRWTVGTYHQNFSPNIYMKGIDIDNNGNIYVSGAFSKPNVPQRAFTSTDSSLHYLSGGEEGFYYIKYDSAGVLQWITTETGPKSLNLNKLFGVTNDIDVDNDGNLYATGAISENFTGVQNFHLLSTDTVRPIYQSVFIMKLGKDGLFSSDISLDIDSLYCAGDSIHIPFETHSDIQLLDSCVYELYFSNQFGIFTNPNPIGILSSNNYLDTVHAKLPANCVNSNKYRYLLKIQNLHIQSSEYPTFIQNVNSNRKIDTLTCPNTPILLEANKSDYYYWNIASMQNDSLQQYISISPYSDTLITCTNANGCRTAIDSFQIRIFNPVSIVHSPDTSICQGDTIMLHCASPSQVNWFPLNHTQSINSKKDSIWVFPSQSTSYQYTLIDSTYGCSEIGSILVDVNPSPWLQNTQSNYTICQGDTIQFNLLANGSALWDNAFSLSNPMVLTPLVYPTSNTDYTLTLSDTSTMCSRKEIISVWVNPDANHPITYNGFEMSVPANLSFYQWYENGNLILGANTNTYFPATNTLYKVYMINQYLCDGESEILMNSILESSSNQELSVFPNPCIDVIHVEFKGWQNQQADFVLLDMLGKRIWEEKNASMHKQENTYRIDLDRNQIKSGMYMLKCTTKENTLTTKIIVK